MKLTAGGLAVLVLALAPSAQAATRPDLRVRALTPASATAAPGTTLTLSATVSNAGRARAGRSVVRVLRSTDAKRDKRDTVLAKANVRALAPGKLSRLTIRVKLPATPGATHVLICADDLGKVRETRETNNCRAARVTLAAPPSSPAPAPVPAQAQSLAVAPSTPAANGCAASDAPDLHHVDSDCDGIDGTAATSVFVSVTGNDANPGTKAAPKRTVSAGIAEAVKSARGAVLISGGQFPERPIIVNGINLYGAYDASSWQRSDVNVTWISGGATNGGSEGARAENIQDPTTLQRLRITAPNTSYGSAYGLVAINASRLRLERVDITAGNGGKGASGPSGSDRSDGQPGSPGKGGGCDSNIAGAGGPGGSPSGTAFGGAGGAGGYGSLLVNGKLGLPGSGAVPGGQGGLTADPGKPGENGASGGDGATGTFGNPGYGGEIIDDLWRSGQGADGQDGHHGQGGGGGGGGGGQDVYIYYGGGNGGGGGGAGGIGGAGGRGGKGGGASFGVFALYSPGLGISDSTITSSAGGAGGYGGYGGQGGKGGLGGPGAKLCLDEVGAGGNGGNGGHGGSGGIGGSGAGGPSFALYGKGGMLSVTTTILAHGTPGLGGSPGTSAPRGGV